MEVCQIFMNTNTVIICNDQIFMETLASKAHEGDEERRKQKNASLAIAAFTQKGSGKDKQKQESVLFSILLQ